MKLIDRIALNRAVSLLLNFIIRLLETFNKKNKEGSKPVTPKPRPRPLKNVIDHVIPWRQDNE
jgi:hypothetical protein